MRWVALPLISGLLATFALAQPWGQELNRYKGKPVPEAVFTDLDGKTVKLSQHKGKVVVLNFWSVF